MSPCPRNEYWQEAGSQAFRTETIYESRKYQTRLARSQTPKRATAAYPEVLACRPGIAGQHSFVQFSMAATGDSSNRIDGDCPSKCSSTDDPGGYRKTNDLAGDRNNSRDFCWEPRQRQDRFHLFN